MAEDGNGGSIPTTSIIEISPSPSEQNTLAPKVQNPPDVAPKPSDTDTKFKGGTAGKVYSDIWSHYLKLKVDGKDKARCNYCSKDLLGDPRQGTSHLKKHYERCPKRKFKDIKQQVLQANFNKEKFELLPYNFDQEASRKELAKMILMHEYPMSMVDHEGFRSYSKSLNPCFKMVSRNTIKKECFDIYNISKVVIMHTLEKIEGRVALTTDMWTSSQKKGYMAVTAHYIDNSWKLQSRIIRFIYVPCPHTSEVLYEALMQCLIDWNIDNKLSTITVDNCSTNDAMMALVLDKLDKLHSGSLLVGGSLIHMRCGAHILNLIVKEGLEVIGEAIERIRDSVAYWVSTPKRWEKFEDTARHVKVPIGKKLVLDCKTRWNSTYLMLHIAMQYKDVFSRLVHREPKYKCAPSELDWRLIKEISGKLEIFYNATKAFSGTKYPTANLFFPIICEIKVALDQWRTCGIEVIERMSSEMVKKFEKYWSGVHGLMGVGAILDPRYKVALLECYFSEIYHEDSDFEVEKILNVCRKLVEQYEENERLNDDGQTSGPEKNVSKPAIFSLSKFNLYASQKKRKPTRSELDIYLEEDILPESSDFDVLSWWRSNKGKYPILHKIARDILAIPVSTVASESAFSTSGRVIGPHRSRLHPDTIEALMCAQSWLLAELKGDCSSDQARATVFEDLDD